MNNNNIPNYGGGNNFNNEVNVNNTLNSAHQDNSQNVVMPNFNSNSEVLNDTYTINPNFNQLNNPNMTTSNVSRNTEPILYDTTTNINTNISVKKKKQSSLKIDPELKFAIILTIVLLVGIIFIPTIFDLLSELKLKFFG